MSEQPFQQPIYHIGVDNGVTGAAVILASETGQVVAKTPMPVLKARQRKEVDVRELHWWFHEYIHDFGRAVFTLEEPGGSKSASALASMAGSFHAIRAIFAVERLRWHRITPRKWQDAMIPGSKGDTKARALTAAKELWPNESWLASKQCRTPHDGMIDAALIAEYARRTNL